MDKVRFGIVGLGNMGSIHARSMKDVPGAELTAVCDKDPEKLKKIVDSTGAKGFADYQSMIGSGLVDAVLIAVPHYEHVPMALAAFEKGLHVLCEKPVSVGVKSARQLNDAYTKKYSHLKFGIMFQMRTAPAYKKMREIIADGELGQITRMTWIATTWFRTWTYYASGGWRATWSGEGGGVLINQCPHNLDQIGWITGLTPKRVTATAHIAKTHPIEVEDEVSAIIEFTNGATGHFITTTGEAPGSDRLEIAGDRGKIIAENGKLTIFRTRKSVQETNRTTKESFPNMEAWESEVPVGKREGEGHKVITENFINAILKNEPLISPGIEGIRGLELGNAMLMAGLRSKPVDFPVDGDAFDVMLVELAKTYGGKKQLQNQTTAVVDMGKSFH
ncbi:MAG TPA: Gfo/Idh/MocA family oxidoreductase [Tepidisphaeraceae bacterium]|jgi:predicted dehydrogenase